MKWQRRSREERRADWMTWRPWFAWHPVRVDPCTSDSRPDWRWLEVVERRWTVVSEGFERSWAREHRSRACPRILSARVAPRAQICEARSGLVRRG